MADPIPQQLQLAMSYLTDVEAQTQQISPNEHSIQRDDKANKIEKGDLARAFKEIEKAKTQGVSASDIAVVLSLAYFQKGMLAMAVLSGKLYEASTAKKYKRKAEEAFTNSINSSPSAEAYYNLGLSHLSIKAAVNKEAATAAFRQAAELDPALNIQVQKQIGQMEDIPTGFNAWRRDHCFVATACYGSLEHPDVVVFRQWRDRVLLPSVVGRLVVRFYYMVSPPVAVRIAKLPRLANAIRRYILSPIAGKLK